MTTQAQAVAQELGISMDRIECIQADTDATMYDLGNYSSRGTYAVSYTHLDVYKRQGLDSLTIRFFLI